LWLRDRSSEPEKFVGKPVRTRPEDLAARPPRAIDTILGLDGINYRSGHVRSELTGWTISVGLPERMLQATSNRLRMDFAGAAAIVLLITMAGAYRVGGHFAELYGALGIDREPSREEFSVLFEHAPNGVVVADGRGSIVLVNDQMEKEFGFSRGELIGKPIETLIPERFRAAIPRSGQPLKRMPSQDPWLRGASFSASGRTAANFRSRSVSIQSAFPPAS
jgi:PAS domain-containing protein